MWERPWEKFWNNLKCLKRCAFQCIQTALKVWKWGFVKSKKVWNHNKSELSHPCSMHLNITSASRQKPSIVSPAPCKLPTSSLLEIESSLTLALWLWEDLHATYLNVQLCYWGYQLFIGHNMQPQWVLSVRYNFICNNNKAYLWLWMRLPRLVCIVKIKAGWWQEWRDHRQQLVAGLGPRRNHALQ